MHYDDDSPWSNKKLPQFPDPASEPEPSDLSPSEIAAPSGSLAVTTCSLRVPAAPLFALLAKWEQRSVNAATRQQAYTQEGKHHQSDKYFDRRCAYDARIVELRRAMGYPQLRQPEENKPVSHGLSEAKDVAL